jgi:hypothetical protein
VCRLRGQEIDAGARQKPTESGASTGLDEVGPTASVSLAKFQIESRTEGEQ